MLYRVYYKGYMTLTLDAKRLPCHPDEPTQPNK